MPACATCSSKAAICNTDTRVPALAMASAISASDGQRTKISFTPRSAGAGRKLISATCKGRIGSEAGYLRQPQAHQPVGQVQLPRLVVFALAITPRGHRAQAAFGPRRRTQVLHGGETTTQHGDEILDVPTQVVGEPRRIGMAGIVDPALLRPFFRRG